MKELDLYGLSTRTPVRLYGDAKLEDAVRHAWTRCLHASAGEPALDTDPVAIQLLEDGSGQPNEPDIQAADTDLATLLQSFTQAVTYAKIRAQAGRLFMFHAGAVAHATTGEAVAFVAQGGTGKTTLAKRLAYRYGYLTDETVGVDAAGFVHPYPKPLSTRRAEGATKDEVSPDELGLLPAPTSPRLRRLILLNRIPEHDSAPRIEEVGVIEAMIALAPETSSLSAIPRPLHALAGLLDGLDPILRLTYSEAEFVIDHVEDWVGAP